jgi:outer membrane immunogenic protein
MFSGAAMKRLATAIATIALIGTPGFAADMAVKAPPSAPAPVPTWTGFYGGIQFGGGWGDEAVNYSPNDPFAVALFNGIAGVQGAASGYRIPQNGPVGGVEVGYNWQWSNWVLGLEADFSVAGMSGKASGTTVFLPGATQTTTAQQETDWYGTVRGRLGWLATPNLLLFGTGGFAYGRVDDSANYTPSAGFIVAIGGFVSNCTASGVPCFIGSSSAIRTGWRGRMAAGPALECEDRISICRFGHRNSADHRDSLRDLPRRFVQRSVPRSIQRRARRFELSLLMMDRQIPTPMEFLLIVKSAGISWCRSTSVA